MERPEGSNEMPPGVSAQQPTFTPGSPPKSPPPKKEAPKEEPKEEPMEVDDDEAKAKKAADELKTQGNTAYKARKFDEAIELYEKAWETYPKDVAYLTNLSGEFQDCVA